jgi:sialic acid synthase
MRSFTLGTRTITDASPCYVIGEIGHNHQGNVSTARQLIQSCAAAGADAVKFQKRDNDTLFTGDARRAV